MSTPNPFANLPNASPFAGLPQAGGNPFANLPQKPPGEEAIAPVKQDMLESAMQPVQELLPIYSQMEAKRRAEFTQRLDELFQEHGTWNRLKNSGMLLLEGANYAMTPLSAAISSIVARPTERALGIPHEMTQMAAETFVPFTGYTRYGRAAAATLGEVAASVTKNPSFVTLQTAFAPATVVPEGEEVGRRISERLADFDLRQEQAQASLSSARDFVERLTPQERVQFIHNHEHNISHGNPALDQLSLDIKAMFEQRVNEVRSYGPEYLKTLLDHYFPHLWKDASRAQVTMSPLLGSRSFLRERVYRYFSDGLAHGLEPAHANPVDAVLAKIREMDRFIVNKGLIDSLKEEGYLKHFKDMGRPPEGWTQIRDPIGSVWQYSEDAKGMIYRGQYAARDTVARVINNHLDPNLLTFTHEGKVIRPMEPIRQAANTLNMLQLGVSAFHLGFVGLDSVISKASLALYQTTHGEIGGAVKSMLQMPIAPFEAFWKGREFYNSALNPAANPQMARYIEALVKGGGRIRMPEYYAAAERGGFLKAAYADAYRRNGWKGVGEAFNTALSRNISEVAETFHDKGIWRGVLNTAGRAAQTTSSWLMEGLVPRMKLGVFHDMVKAEMLKNPAMGPREFRDTMQRAWASVDNRMGEFVYDNLHWNRTLKDLMHIMIRSVGWNLGTFRELGGGITDVGKAGSAFLRGEELEFTHRMAYTVALPMVTALFGGTMHRLMTGKSPEELKDYFFPQTGGVTQYGTPERLSLPSYMKDIYEYGYDAPHALINKTNPLIPVVHQMLSSEDYFGMPISDPDAPGADQVVQYMQFLGRSFEPFSVQGYLRMARENEGHKSLAALFGVTPAPGYITSPEEVDALRKRHEQQLYRKKLIMEGKRDRP
jgi:hypothetical protein